MRILSFSTMRRTCAPWKEILFAVAFIRIHGGRKPHLSDTLIEVDYVAIDYQASSRAFKRSNYSGEASQNARPLLSNTSEETHAILLQTANHSQSLQNIVNASNVHQTLKGEEEQEEAKTGLPPLPDGRISMPEVLEFTQQRASSPARTYFKCMEGDSELVHRGTDDGDDGVLHYNQWHTKMEDKAKLRCTEYGQKCAAAQVVRVTSDLCSYELYSRCVHTVYSSDNPSSLFFKKYGGTAFTAQERVAVIQKETEKRFPAKVVQTPGKGDSSYKIVLPKRLRSHWATEIEYETRTHDVEERQLVKWATYEREQKEAERKQKEAEAFEAAGGYAGMMMTAATDGLSKLPGVADAVGGALRPLTDGLSEFPAVVREYVSAATSTEYSPPADKEDERESRSILFEDNTEDRWERYIVFSHNPIGLTLDQATLEVTEVEKESNAAELGVEEGWRVMVVGNVPVHGQTYPAVLKLIGGLAARLNYYTSILFQVDGAPDQYITFERQPLGIEISRRYLAVTAVRDASHAQRKGVHPGWKLKTVGGVPVEGQNYEKVVLPAMTMLNERLGPPPVPSRFRAKGRSARR